MSACICSLAAPESRRLILKGEGYATFAMPDIACWLAPMHHPDAPASMQTKLAGGRSSHAAFVGPLLSLHSATAELRGLQGSSHTPCCEEESSLHREITQKS